MHLSPSLDEKTSFFSQSLPHPFCIYPSFPYTFFFWTKKKKERRRMAMVHRSFHIILVSSSFCSCISFPCLYSSCTVFTHSGFFLSISIKRNSTFWHYLVKMMR
ncbi:MAG: hypothetical protein J3Q66DRAFT_172116 [Benniella sp.]|nr:MAG: hypothetical protein J3Q66DRAFT_172116 [Benniella sp.]